MIELLFSFVVFRDRVDEGRCEEAGHSEQHQHSVVTEVSVAVHCETPALVDSYLTMEYLWKMKPILLTTIWLT